MQCKLCNLEKQICKSHIIPKTIYSAINDKINRSVPISKKKKKLKFIQNGFKEKLLCKDCEVKFSVWENILKMVLGDIGNRSSPYLSIREIKKNILHVENIRYEEFKLAALSILWRFSVSNESFFDSYDLGPYELKIRDILYSGKCPQEKKYPLSLCQYEVGGKFDTGVYMGFPPERYEGMFIVQKFIIWGHMFLFFVNDHLFPNLPIDDFLRENGSLYVPIAAAEEFNSPDSVMARIYDDDVRIKMKQLLT